MDGNPPTPPPLPSPSPYQRDFFLLFFLQCHSHTLVSFSSLNPLVMSLVGTASREFEVTHVGKKIFRLENIKQKKKYCEPIFSAPQVPNHANVDWVYTPGRLPLVLLLFASAVVVVVVATGGVERRRRSWLWWIRSPPSINQRDDVTHISWYPHELWKKFNFIFF